MSSSVLNDWVPRCVLFSWLPSIQSFLYKNITLGWDKIFLDYFNVSSWDIITLKNGIDGSLLIFIGIVEDMPNPSPTTFPALDPVSSKNDWPIVVQKVYILSLTLLCTIQTLVIINFPPYTMLVYPHYLLLIFLSHKVKLYPNQNGDKQWLREMCAFQSSGT